MRIDKLNEGALCQLKMGRWDASIRMDKNKLGKSVPKEIVRAMQDLVDDRTHLQAMASVRRAAKNFLISHSLAFPVDGVFWVMKKDIEKIDAFFTERKNEYMEMLKVLKKNLPKMKRKFEKAYPKFYDETFYPTVDELDRKFYFTWNFFHFTIPSKKTQVLSPEMYRRETEKLHGMVKEMEEMTVNLIGNELLKRIEKLKDQCENDSINAATVGSVDRFMEKWKELWQGNVDNHKLHGIMKSMRVQMARTSADKLKNSDEFRAKAAEKLSKVINRIENVPNIEIKRKMDI